MGKIPISMGYIVFEEALKFNKLVYTIYRIHLEMHENSECQGKSMTSTWYCMGGWDVCLYRKFYKFY